MAARSVHWHRILARHGEPRDVVSPDDFELGFEGAGEAAPRPAGLLAYCADFARERLLYTMLPRNANVFGAAFLYSAQLAAAAGVVSVPFERLGEMGQPEARPVLVFSPGRAGSTLLARLLRAAGAAAASEPDWPTQLCLLDEAGQTALGAALAREVVRAGWASLAAQLGPGFFVKLRSQCNTRPEALAAPGMRAVFLLRRMEDWALSRHRAFAEPADIVAQTLRDALVAVDRLRRAGCAPEFLWFEALVADPAGAVAELLGREVDTAPLQAVMAEDSQAGTGLDRAVVAGRGVEAGFLDAFAAEWALRRPAGALGARLADVLEMF